MCHGGYVKGIARQTTSLFIPFVLYSHFFLPKSLKSLTFFPPHSFPSLNISEQALCHAEFLLTHRKPPGFTCLGNNPISLNCYPKRCSGMIKYQKQFDQKDQGSDCPSVLSTGVLCSVLGLSIQEIH